MKREEFIKYLSDNACNIIRTDKAGYSVCRNIVNGAMSGVPVTDPVYPATACRICKTLGIAPPDEVLEAKEIIDLAHKKHGRNDA